MIHAPILVTCLSLDTQHHHRARRRRRQHTSNVVELRRRHDGSIGNTCDSEVAGHESIHVLQHRTAHNNTVIVDSFWLCRAHTNGLNFVDPPPLYYRGKTQINIHSNDNTNQNNDCKPQQRRPICQICSILNSVCLNLYEHSEKYPFDSSDRFCNRYRTTVFPKKKQKTKNKKQKTSLTKQTTKWQ
jgi:hypothetical protein